MSNKKSHIRQEKSLKTQKEHSIDFSLPIWKL